MPAHQRSTPFDDRPGLRVRALRKERGLTQAKLAKAVGVSAAMVGHWERGLHPIELRFFPLLAGVLRVPEWRLHGFKLSPEGNVLEKSVLDLVDLVLNSGGQPLLDALKQLPPDQITAAILGLVATPKAATKRQRKSAKAKKSP